MTNRTKIVTSAVIGTIAGAALGILFAPHKGSKTRAKLSEKAKVLSDATAETYSKAKNVLGIKPVNKEAFHAS